MKTRIISIVIILLLLTTALLAQEGPTIKNQERIQYMIQIRLKLAKEEAKQVMAQIRKRLQERKQIQLHLTEKNVDAMLRLCKQNRLRSGEIAKVMAAGSEYAGTMAKLGAPKKEVHRNMYMYMYSAMQQSKGEGSKKVAARIMKRLQTQQRKQLRDAVMAKDGSGKMIRNRYRKQYQGEKGYKGTHGGNKKDSPGKK